MEVSLSELRTKLTEVMEAVKKGERVFVTERGKPIAVLGPPAKNLAKNDVKVVSEREIAQIAQRARDEILRGINRKS